MLRRNIRLRKEYLYKKSLEADEQRLVAAKRSLQESLDSGKPLHSELQGSLGQQLKEKLNLEDDVNKVGSRSHIDDEYAYAGEPKILITTSRDPSSRLLQFVKELTLTFPNSQRLNRGSYVMKDLVQLSQENGLTDIAVVHEHRGEPAALIVSHMPLGPTAYFSISDVSLRHDLPTKPPNMSQVAPHLIFHNFVSSLGLRVQSILQHLFPPANPLGQRCVSFSNIGDRIHFRHHTWSYESTEAGKDQADCTETGAQEPKKPHQLQLLELGPRFTMKLFKIELATLEMKDVQTEWTLKPFFNKSRAALS